MRRKYEVTDRTGRLHTRQTESRTYTHAVIIHFKEQLPSKMWPTGWPPFSRSEWAGSRQLAENVMRRYQRYGSVEAVELLDAKEITRPIKSGDKS